MLTSPICHTEISHKVKYFRLTDFKSRRRGWSPAEADDKGGLSGLQETLYQIIKSPLQESINFARHSLHVVIPAGFKPTTF